MAHNAPTSAQDKGSSRETLEQQVGAVLWKMQDSQFAGHTLPPSQVATEVIAMVREQVAREIEADKGCHQELMICPGCHAARLARGDV